MLVGILALGLAVPTQASAPEPKPAPIVAALQARQKGCRSLIAEWDEETTYPRGAVSAMFGGMAGIGNDMPPEDVTFTARHKLVLDGEYGHHIKVGDEYHQDKNKLFPVREDTLYTVEKNVFCRFFLVADPGLRSSGAIRKEKGLHPSLAPDYSALLAAVRPLDPPVQINAAVLDKVEPAVGKIDGAEFDFFTCPVQPDYFMEIWTTREDHRIVRIVHRGKASIGVTSLRYEQRPDGEHVPSGWEEVAQFGNPRFTVRRTRGTVRSFRMNGPIPASELTFNFPAGIEVTDSIEREWRNGPRVIRGGTRYMTKPDGSLEQIFPTADLVPR